MKQSASPATPPGLHVGIIMDGNGRWATGQGRSRSAGHHEGARTVRRVVEAAPGHGDRRAHPLRVQRRQLAPPAGRSHLADAAVRRIPAKRDGAMRRQRRAAWRSSAGGTGSAPACAGRSRWPKAKRPPAPGLRLRIALDYSARDAILRAAQCLRPDAPPSSDSFGRLLAIVDHGTPVPEVDLLIRTGGERRLSDFLLWEAAYAELHFTPLMWPEFGPGELGAAVADFATRDRRFGGLGNQTPASRVSAEARHTRPPAGSGGSSREGSA